LRNFKAVVINFCGVETSVFREENAAPPLGVSRLSVKQELQGVSPGIPVFQGGE